MAKALGGFLLADLYLGIAGHVGACCLGRGVLQGQSNSVHRRWIPPVEAMIRTPG